MRTLGISLYQLVHLWDRSKRSYVAFDKNEVRLDCVHPSQLCPSQLCHHFLNSVITITNPSYKESSTSNSSLRIPTMSRIITVFGATGNQGLFSSKITIPRRLPTEISSARFFCSECHPHRRHVRPPCRNSRCIVRVCAEAESPRRRGCAGRFLGY